MRFKSYPDDDWAHDAADAFRYLAVGHRITVSKPAKQPPRQRYEIGNDGRQGRSDAWMGV